MTEKKIDLIWALTSTILNAIMGIVLLPLMLNRLDSNSMALWYVFAAIQNLIFLLDLGFGPSITRNVAYAFAGSKSIATNSVNVVEGDNSKPNTELLSSLYHTSKKFYLIVSLIGILILCSAGLIYIISIIPDNRSYYLFCYLFFCIAVIANIYFSHLPSFMKGIGAITEQYKCYIVARIIYIVVGLVLLLTGYGLISVCIAMLASGLSLGITTFFYLKHYLKKKGLIINKVKASNAIFKTMGPNVAKEALIAISNFISSNILTFICTSAYGLDVEAQYGLTLQILNLLATLCLTYFTMVQPRISACQATGSKDRIKVLFFKSYSFFFLWYLIGFAVIFFFARPCLDLVESNTDLLNNTGLILFAISVFVEKNVQLYCSYISTKNTLPYTIPFIINAITIILFDFLFAMVIKIDISLLALVSIASFACYNLWRWRLYLYKEFDTFFMFHKGIVYWVKDLFRRKENAI